MPPWSHSLSSGLRAVLLGVPAERDWHRLQFPSACVLCACEGELLRYSVTCEVWHHFCAAGFLSRRRGPAVLLGSGTCSLVFSACLLLTQGSSSVASAALRSVARASRVCAVSPSAAISFPFSAPLLVQQFSFQLNPACFPHTSRAVSVSCVHLWNSCSPLGPSGLTSMSAPSMLCVAFYVITVHVVLTLVLSPRSRFLWC